MLGGAYSLTHWYCPPALGDMEAISAIDATTCGWSKSDLVTNEARRCEFAYGYSEDPCCKEGPDSALVQSLGLAGSVSDSSIAYSSATIDERKGARSAKVSAPPRPSQERAHLRQDAHPSTHNHASQTKDWNGVEISLLTRCEHYCMRTTNFGICHTFNS